MAHFQGVIFENQGLQDLALVWNLRIKLVSGSGANGRVGVLPARSEQAASEAGEQSGHERAVIQAKNRGAQQLAAHSAGAIGWARRSGRSDGA